MSGTGTLKSAGWSVAAFLLAALHVAAVPQDSKEIDDSGYWPIVTGSKWTHVAKKQDREMELTWTATASNGTRRFRKECIKLEMEMLDSSAPKGAIAKKTWTLYVVQRKDGLVIGDWEGMGGDDFGYLLKFPLKRGTTWENQIFGAPAMRIGDDAEEVRVPAGAFKCKRIEFVNKYPGTTFTTRWWLAPGTGLVKIESVSKSDKGVADTETVELKKYEAPKALSNAEFEGVFVKVRVDVARQHLKNGAKDKAIEVLEDLLKTYPKSPEVPEIQRLLEEARKK